MKLSLVTAFALLTCACGPAFTVAPDAPADSASDAGSPLNLPPPTPDPPPAAVASSTQAPDAGPSRARQDAGDPPDPPTPPGSDAGPGEPMEAGSIEAGPPACVQVTWDVACAPPKCETQPDGCGHWYGCGQCPVGYVAPEAGPTPVTCSAGNCLGCCDDQSLCHYPWTDSYCGSQGLACSECVNMQQTCAPPGNEYAGSCIGPKQ